MAWLGESPGRPSNDDSCLPRPSAITVWFIGWPIPRMASSAPRTASGTPLVPRELAG